MILLANSVSLRGVVRRRGMKRADEGREPFSLSNPKDIAHGVRELVKGRGGGERKERKKKEMR